MKRAVESIGTDGTDFDGSEDDHHDGEESDEDGLAKCGDVEESVKGLDMSRDEGRIYVARLDPM